MAQITDLQLTGMRLFLLRPPAVAGRLGTLGQCLPLLPLLLARADQLRKLPLGGLFFQVPARQRGRCLEQGTLTLVQPCARRGEVLRAVNALLPALLEV